MTWEFAAYTIRLPSSSVAGRNDTSSCLPLIQHGLKLKSKPVPSSPSPTPSYHPHYIVIYCQPQQHRCYINPYLLQQRLTYTPPWLLPIVVEVSQFLFVLACINRKIFVRVFSRIIKMNRKNETFGDSPPSMSCPSTKRSNDDGGGSEVGHLMSTLLKSKFVSLNIIGGRELSWGVK